MADGLGRPSLDAFFDPRTVAVVGASADPAKIGGSVLANLRGGGFAGRILAVNARTAMVQGLAAVPSLRDAGGGVDVAVIAVPAAAVLPVLKDCVATGVRGAVLLSAGFREAGAAGADREAELRAWLVMQPLRLVGPNCLGWIRPAKRLNLTFAPGMPRTGPLGFFSHSGALCAAILDWSRDHAIGFSLFASLGNQADVDESDVLEALTEDPETRVILGYVEGVADGRRFFAALSAAAARKPCVLMKAGRSQAGARAVLSHTGALAGSDRAFEAAVRQAGAVRAESLEELFDLARALAAAPLPAGRRVTIVTNGGGLGILATDAAAAAGLELPPPDAGARQRLAEALPPQASLGNPIDLVGDAGAARYGAALAALGDGDDARIVMLTPTATTDAAGVARTIAATTRDWRAPVLAVFAGGARVRAGTQILEDEGVATYAFPERAVRALAGMVTLGARRRLARTPWRSAGDDGAAARHVAGLVTAGVRRLGFVEAAPLLAAYGIPTVASRTAATPAAAAAASAALGGRVALKIVSPDISHKTDVGGVSLGVRPDEVEAAAEAMLARVRQARPDARIEGLLVQAMAPAASTELLLGAVRDPQFGPLVMVGFGGVLVEVIADVATRLAPVTPADALAMLGELKTSRLLEGARGAPPVDRLAVADTLCRFAALVAARPELEELEINPLVAGPGGVLAVDARGALGRPGSVENAA